MDKKEIKEGQAIILTIIDTFPSLEEINSDNNNEEISLSIHGKNSAYSLMEIIENKQELHYKIKPHIKNSLKIFLLKNNTLFATGTFLIKTGDQWVTFSYENKKKNNNSLALSLINCIKLKFLCKIDKNPNSTYYSENENNTNIEFSFSNLDISNKKNNNNVNIKTTVSHTIDNKSHHKTPKTSNNNTIYKNNTNKNNTLIHNQKRNYNYLNNDLMQSMSTNNVVKEKLILPNTVKNTSQISKFNDFAIKNEPKKFTYGSHSKRTRCSYDNLEKMKTEPIHSSTNYGIANTTENNINNLKKNNIKRKKSKSNMDINKNKANNKMDTQSKTSNLSKFISERNNNGEEKNLNNDVNNVKIKDKKGSINNSKNISVNNSEKNIFAKTENKKTEEIKEEIMKEETKTEKEKEEEVQKEENLQIDDSSSLNDDDITDNYSKNLADFRLFYSDEYFIGIKQEDLALEIELYIEKFIELVSEYHVQIGEKELEYQIIKNFYKENFSLYKEMKKIIKKLNNIKENYELKNNSFEKLNKVHEKNSINNLNTSNDEINFFNFLLFSEMKTKIKEKKENLKKIVKNLLNKENNKKILSENEKFSKWMKENLKLTNNKGLKSKKKMNYSNKTLINYNKITNKKKNEVQTKTVITNNKVKSKNKFGKNNYNNEDNKKK